MNIKKHKPLLLLLIVLTLGLAIMPKDAFAVHSHSFALAWSFDTLGHWHACTGSDCPETDLSTHTSDGFAYAAHSFGDDKVCTVCGAKEECEVLPYSSMNARPATEAEGSLFNKYYHCEGTDIIVDGSPLFDSTGVAAGNNAYYLNIIPKDSSVLISRIEAVVSDYGSDYYNVGISGGVKQEDAVTGVAEGTTVHINEINAGSFSFGGGYSTVEFNTITVYFVRTTPPCEHSFTGAYQNNSINHARKCVKCGEYGPAEAHSFTKHECVCGAKEITENSEALLYNNGSYASGTYQCEGTNFKVVTDHFDESYGISVGGNVTLKITSKDPSLKITRIEAVVYFGDYIFVIPSSGEKAEKSNVENGTTVHINNVNATTLTLTGTPDTPGTKITDITVYYTDGKLAHDFTGAYKDNENGKHQRKCTKCDEYNAEENHTYEDGVCVCGAEDPSEFVINSEGVLIKYNGNGGAVVLPEGIISIGDGVFAGNTAITSVEIPYYGTYGDENIIGIGASAFKGCKNLTSIIPEIPFTVKTIGDNAFSGCEKLTTVTVAEIITHNVRKPVLGFLGEDAFDGNYLKTIKYYCYLAPEEVEEMMGRYEGSTPFTYEQLPHQYEDHECVLCGAIEHIHSFTYQVSGNTVTATCSSTAGDCELTDKKAVLTLTAAGGTYDGTTAFPAGFGTGEESVWKAAFGTVPVIHYYLNGNEIEAAPVNAGEYTAKITVDSKTAEITYTISKATPVYTVPTGLTAEYGKTLKDVALPTGFSWQDADTTAVGNVGDHTFKVTYTPADTANYNTVKDIEVTVKVTAKKLSKPSAEATEFVYDGEAKSLVVTGYDSATMTENGTLSATNADNYSVTYGLKDKSNYTWEDASTGDVTISWKIKQAQAPAIQFPTANGIIYDPAVTLEKVALNGGSTEYGTFVWKNPSTIPTAGTTDYAVVFTPSALAAQNYGLLESEKGISLNVAKATPAYTVPTGLTSEYGKTLKDIMLPEGFSCQDADTTAVGNAGNNTFKVTYTPVDTANYNVVNDIEITVAVAAKKLSKPTAEATEFVYNGETQSLVVTGYDNATMTENGTISATNADNYSVSYSLKDKSNYTWEDGSIGDVTVNWTIKKAAAPTIIFPTASEITFNPDLTLNQVALNGGSTEYGTFAWKNPSTIPTAGTTDYVVVFTPSALAAQNYGLTKEEDGVSLTVSKATPSYTVPTGLTAEYGKTLKDVALPTGFSWQDADTTAVGNVGDHAFKVTYTPADTANYNTVKNIEVTVKVTAKKLSKPSAEATEFVYDGEAKSLVVTGYDSATMTENGTLSATNADSYSVTYGLKDKSNYTWEDASTGDVTISWKIKQAQAPAIQFPTANGITYDPAVTLEKVALNGGSTEYGTFAWKNPSTIPTAGTTDYAVVFTPSALAAQNYGLTKEEDGVSLTVSKATPSYIVPTGLTSEYGKTLKDITLPEGFNCQDADMTAVGNAGNNTFKVTYTPVDTANYNVVNDIEITVAVAAKKLTKPTAEATEFVYNGETQSLTVTGYDSATMTENGTLSATNADSYSVTYGLKDKDNYIWEDDSTDDVTLDWSIKQAPAPAIQFPTASGIDYDPAMTLKKASLNGGSTEYGTFAWKNPAAVPTMGTAEYTVVFTPSALAAQNYGLTTSERNITLNVTKATPSYTAPADITAEYGDTLKDIVLPAGFRWQDADTTPVGDVGEHTFKVTYTPEDTDNYNVVSDIPVTVTVSYADVTVSFNMNGHGTQIPSQTVKHGDKAESPEAPLEAGWVFGGWYQDAELGAEFDFNNALNEDTEIYAKWTREEQPTEGEIIISEEDGEWTQGKNMPLSFRLKAEAGKSACVLVDDILLDSANYTFESEPAALILKPSYLKTLSVGQHKLTIRTEDSETSRYFVIKAAGINPSWFLWLIPLVVIVLGILAIIYFRRKKKKSN